ncbi:protein kinase-like domain, concanavalin A-like lectin/glucanase domain protein [Tanacetum coccineum]
MVKPKIRGNVNFEIKSQFMRELREDTFSENKNDDAHEHVERVLDIVTLFNIPGVTHDAVMLQVFPITRTGAAERWVDRLSLGTVDSWDLLKKVFIQRYYPSSKTAKQLEDICNFKYEGDETLYQAWERNIDRSSSNSEGFAAIVSKLDSLGRDMKKPKENMHAIQVGCQLCGGPYLDMECPLTKEVKSLEEFKYGEFGRSFTNNSQNDDRFRRASGYDSNDQPSSSKRRPTLIEIINKYMEEVAKRHAEQDEWTLTNEVEGRTNDEKFEECKEIFTKDGSPLYTPFYYSPEEIEYYSTNLGFSDNERQTNQKWKRLYRLSILHLNKFPKKKSKLLDFNNALADLGASISIMPLSMYKCLGMGKLEPINKLLVLRTVFLCLTNKTMYNSWQSRTLLYIKGKKNGRMMLESINNGLLVYPTVEENSVIRPKKYAKLTKQEQLQDDYDVQETNIVLQGLSPDVYALVNHYQTAKDIWERVKLPMQGTELSYQERECKLYNEFDKFTSVKGESLREYYL